ncbi:AbrB family transcriptional regulator [Xanthobacter autotrophicus]|nr:AbrB family transcriptional regulator [Xanthobacter autotrophicus]UDQ89703.1 AbrB family transcriptional regulator [Xanthobacter autotrophicus]UJX47398.1 AbrB family transcriptional regulator [Xanthobacter sp. YC-JY1]GLI20955.1 membrane protein [Xanthobacter flavus]
MRSAASAAVTLGAGALGGLIFALLGLPAAWISGSLVACIGLALAGMRIDVPEWLRFLAFVVLGTSMGTMLTPETFARAATWPVSMACLGASVLGTMAGGTLFLTRVAGWSRESAFWASAPGAFGTVVAMAADTNADLRQVAFAQTLRLFLLVAALPNVLAALGMTAGGVPPPPHVSTLGEIVVLFVVCTAAALLAARLKLPGGLILGALAGSAVLHATRLSTAVLPAELLIPAFVVLGGSVGVRFIGTSLSTIRAYVLASLGAFLVAVAISTLFALLAAWLTGDDLGKLVTAFAPGALEAMTALGFAMGYDPAFMSAHHLFRFAGLSVALPVAARLMFAAAEQAGRDHTQ